MTEFLVIGLTVAIAAALAKSRYNYQRLPELKPGFGFELPNLTVIIPARNEAHQIRRAVGSFYGLPVIVVDDSSSDQTADVARQSGAQVIHPPPLTGNSKGKPNACAAGADIAGTKWILFADADTWFDPGFANAIVSYAERNGLKAVTAFLEQRCETWAERTLLPYAFALYFTGVSARNVNSSRSKEALANGQCFLFEREAYEAIGGHRSVVDSVIEDVALAQRAKSLGVRLGVVRAERLGHVRMYENFGAIWRGFQKNSFRFLLTNPWSGLQVVVASIALTSWLPVLILARQNVSGIWLIALFFAPMVFLWPWYRGRDTATWWQASLAPLAIYGFQLIALNGMLVTLTGRKTIWKERKV